MLGEMVIFSGELHFLVATGEAMRIDRRDGSKTEYIVLLNRIETTNRTNIFRSFWTAESNVTFLPSQISGLDTEWTRGILNGIAD